ncbi:unnamed protein product [marine sediment metagenome]|uniref:Uncharacterized protein n=1 Tax=marine sediment metagenome TaxID=412755 RepID=X1I606_9ZZZZ
MSAWQQFFVDHFILEGKKIIEFLSWLLIAGDVTGLNRHKLTYEQLEALYKGEPWQTLHQCREKA